MTRVRTMPLWLILLLVGLRLFVRHLVVSERCLLTKGFLLTSVPSSPLSTSLLAALLLLTALMTARVVFHCRCRFSS